MTAVEHVTKRLLGPWFWITAYVALGAGFFLPGDYAALAPLTPFLLGGILYFSLLRIPFHEITAALRDRGRWRAVAGCSAVKLLALPLMLWLPALVLAPEWATGLLLVASMPAGLSSIAFADLKGGDRVLALLLVIATSALAPLTVPLLQLVAGGVVEPWAVLARTAYIALLLCAPFVLAQATRISLPAVVARHHHRWGRGAVACSCALIFVAVASQRHLWAGWEAKAFLVPLVASVAATVLALVTARLARGALGVPGAITLGCAAVYMNNGLAVAFAARFAPGDVHLLMPSLLAQVPMIAGVALMTMVVTGRDDRHLVIVDR